MFVYRVKAASWGFFFLHIITLYCMIKKYIKTVFQSKLPTERNTKLFVINANTFKICTIIY